MHTSLLSFHPLLIELESNTFWSCDQTGDFFFFFFCTFCHTFSSALLELILFNSTYLSFFFTASCSPHSSSVTLMQLSSVLVFCTCSFSLSLCLSWSHLPIALWIKLDCLHVWILSRCLFVGFERIVPHLPSPFWSHMFRYLISCNFCFSLSLEFCSCVVLEQQRSGSKSPKHFSQNPLTHT